MTSFSKKAQELATLCDVQVGIIIFGSEEMILWPSEPHVKQIVERYFSFPELERMNKLVRNVEYHEKMVEDQKESITKIEQKNEEKKMELLFNEVVKGKNIYELDVGELRGLTKLFALKKAQVEERKKQLHEHNQSIEGSDNNAQEKDDGHPKI
ncbi:hypothetical protein CQW23_14736 [Capsicum baccatum]|uniref:MADS-box domain-containing protein n=1 Tax=Capsicum baccatum TaxID=33114 RepID=A0A2G2WK10_CAPBA|nr:hypothetical protein CQW23_14736 [Capsicum baccatum]